MSSLTLKTGNKPPSHITGAMIADMFIASYQLIDKHIELVNGLNVFPVPDGDTGTNMAMTMKAVSAAITNTLNSESNDLDDISRVMARASLMEARGNSGVILSQFFKGIAQGVGDKKSLDVEEWAICMEKAKESAYSAVGNPTEGTMLTVIAEVSRQADVSSKNGDTLESLFNQTSIQIKETVKNTPQLLPILAEAEVVDAGAYGLDIIFEGLRRNLNGLPVADVEIPVPGMKNYKSFALPSKIFLTQSINQEYGFCAQVLISDNVTQTDQIKQTVSQIGDSVVVINESSMLKIHAHVKEVEQLLEYAQTLGKVESHSVDDMDVQKEEFAAGHGKSNHAEITSLISVVDGMGIKQIFIELGASQIIEGGPNNSPSVSDILAKIESAPSENIIFLPNDKNIVLAVQQASELTKKSVEIVPTQTLQQGINCALEFDSKNDLLKNKKHMVNSIKEIKSAEISTAYKNTTLQGVTVSAGEFVGITDGKLITSASTIDEVLGNLLNFEGHNDVELVTLYRGADLTIEESEAHYEQVASKFQNIEFELIDGGQSHCVYMISLE
ncbi:MAG: DAK2 domain-containing protein [Chloroflexota bacterium]|jgi:DAK2 domain fusion protein YloV|tara:strand:+ start:44136 stop:45806 length:1671 start_codon:yes stop_codon:yes gene_type:complete